MKKQIQDIRFVWVDEFITNVRPYIAVRTEDNVLIKRPNVVQKLNSGGAQILSGLLSGLSIASLLKKIGNDEQKLNELHLFLVAIKASLEDTLDVFTMNPAVLLKPFEAPFTTLPVLSEVAITGKCNFRCSFCYAGINNGCSSEEPDLSFEELKSIIEKIRREAKVPSISFTGGEPTLRSDLPQLIAYAKSIDMRVNLISNGFLIDKNLALELKNAGLDSAQISIEGCTAETHEKITGVKNSFAHALEAVRNLRELDIWAHTNTTLSKQNMHEAALLPAFLSQELRLKKFSMNLIIPSGTASEHDENLLPYSEAGEIIRSIQKAATQNNIELMWYSPTPLCLFNTITEGLGNKGCAACDGLVSVDPQGNILPCSSWNEPIGNLLKQSFSEIWNSPRAEHIRNKKETPAVCSSCDSFALCQGACPLFFKHHFCNDESLLKPRISTTQKTAAI